MKKLMFGVNVSTSARPEADPVAEAVRAEQLGFDFISANDHPGGGESNYEVWTMLTWIAARTTRIKVATRVLGVPYRAPAMVAKMAESLDRLSDGRLILGMGGGASDAEFRAFGLRVPSPKAKIEGLEEAVRIIRGLWTSNGYTFDGRHHRTDAADIEPKPDHHIPIWLGTYGKNSLAVTGRVADGWIPTLELAPPKAIPEMREKIFDAAVEVGRDPDKITLVMNLEFHVGHAANLPDYVVTGSSEELQEKLGDLAAYGFHAMNFIPAGPDPARQNELLAREVLPSLRRS
jgi:alkanesulfonate monooxygenase SsuD/methylene tetrahydromethanopterin reductase-like flavin-dependent oxidoreductase (luciferase family)